ncbi:MAG: hypothetical protein ABEH43_05395, partial [Flavobacteriales bacterium]
NFNILVFNNFKIHKLSGSMTQRQIFRLYRQTLISDCQSYHSRSSQKNYKNKISCELEYD